MIAHVVSLYAFAIDQLNLRNKLFFKRFNREKYRSLILKKLINFEPNAALGPTAPTLRSHLLERALEGALQEGCYACKRCVSNLVSETIFPREVLLCNLCCTLALVFSKLCMFEPSTSFLVMCTRH